HMVIAAGKDNAMYLVDRDNMGHYNPNNDNQIVQSLPNIFPFGRPEPGNYSGPVYFNSTVYFGPIADSIQAFKLTNGLLPTSPTASSAAVDGNPGATMSISANGGGNGLLVATHQEWARGGEESFASAAPGGLVADQTVTPAT